MAIHKTMDEFQKHHFELKEQRNLHLCDDPRQQPWPPGPGQSLEKVEERPESWALLSLH